MRDATKYAPLIVVAPPRSYSTVVVAMLGQHPDLFAVPELQLFHGETVEDTLRIAREPVGLYRAIAEIRYGGQEPDALDRARRWTERTRHAPSAALFDHLCGRVEPRILVEKSPDTVLYRGQLERLMAAYPRARYLHLVRHPVATVLSMVEHWGPYASRTRDPETIISNAAKQWYSTHRRLMIELAKLPDGKVLRSVSEDLVRDQTSFDGVFDWLGIRGGSQITSSLSKTERWPFASKLDLRWSWGGGDPKFFEDPRLRTTPNPLEMALPAWKLPDGLGDAISRLAAYFGYEVLRSGEVASDSTEAQEPAGSSWRYPHPWHESGRV